jgi:hypothetical protein
VKPARALRISLLVLLAIAAPLALSGGTIAAVSISGHGVRVIAQNGFGERENSYAWSMGWFKHKLYVGTGRDVLCVEDQTTQYYDKDLNYYVTNPQENVHCPADPYDMDLRAEIWQYTPQTSKWRMVYRSPDTERNPKEPSKRVASDIGFRGMVEYTGPQGRHALYAAGLSADEYLPELLKSHPPQILRSYDGVHWQALKLPSVIVNFPNGSVRPMGFRSLVVWKQRLFVTATPDLTGDGSLFEITNPSSAHPGLIQVSPPNLDIFEVATFDGKLYVGCGSPRTGYSVWETSGQGQEVGELYAPYPFVFKEVVGGGAGRGPIITSVVSMKAYRNALYVGASGWYNKSTNPRSELIRIQADGNWQLVVGKPRKLENGQMIYPISGLEDGFGSLFNAHFWRMTVADGGLYLGTNTWGYLLKAAKGYGFLGDFLAGASGYQLWDTCDGEDWYPVTRDAFGHSEFDFGARTLQPAGPNGEELYIGSANHAQGTTIIDDREPACSSLVNAPRTAGAPAPPTALIADSVHKGTLLSWKPSPSAVRYEVLAAPEITATVYLKAPPTLPNGYQLEGAMPTVTEPEAPGSVPVTLSLSGAFEPVATTTNSYFVRPSGHYVYQVVAESATGKTSGPSNVQVVPAPEPPATFGALQQALGRPVATSARTGSGSPLQRLVDAGQAAWNRGDRSAALLDVKRLQAVAGPSDERSMLAERLERALEYANAAGEP